MAKQIEFDNVSLREPGTGRVLLEEVSLTMPAGKRLGLIGTDDLEKHALVYLIPRLLDLNARGRFPVDRLVKNYPFAELNTAIADSLAGATIKPVLTFG